MELKIGQTIGALTALRSNPDGKWLFRCVCGKDILIYKAYVLRGRYLSCGCIKSIRGVRYGSQDPKGNY